MFSSLIPDTVIYVKLLVAAYSSVTQMYSIFVAQSPWDLVSATAKVSV